MEPGESRDPTMTMEEKIGFYPDLSPEERREVEDYVDRHPRLRGALAQMQRLDRALREGGALSEDPPGDEAVAWAVVARSVDADRLPAALRSALRDLEQRIETNPEARARYRSLEARRAELEAASDAQERFRRLVGHPPESVDETAAASEGGAGARPDTEAGAEERPPTAESGRPPLDRGDAHRKTGRRRRLVAAALAVAGLYLLLFSVSRIIRPEAERMARFDESELVLEGYEEVRGNGEPVDVSDAVVLYLEALEELKESETSFLGLFPRYDATRLAAASDRLQEVIRQEPPESFLSGEASYLLGKTELARGNVAEAREALRRAAASGAAHAGEAERLLSELRDLEGR